MKSPVLVLLPGMMLDHRVFASLSIELPVMVADVTRQASIQQLAEDVLLHAPPRFALAGLSMGGIVALEIWRQAPERISHFALIDTTPYADAEERRALRLEQMGEVDAGRLREVIGGSMLPFYLGPRYRDNPDFANSVIEQAMTLGPAVFHRQSLALKDRIDSVQTLATIRCPSLVLCGREDELCPLATHETMAHALVRADLVALADCGHLAVMEAPKAVGAALNHWLSKDA